jgi:hypothetical protein
VMLVRNRPVCLPIVNAAMGPHMAEGVPHGAAWR